MERSIEIDKFPAYVTYPADKAFCMPLYIQCCYIILHDRSLASTAFRSKHIKVVLLAVRLAILLMKAVITKWFATLGTEEVVRMPGSVHCSGTFLKEKNNIEGKIVNMNLIHK